MKKIVLFILLVLLAVEVRGDFQTEFGNEIQNSEDIKEQKTIIQKYLKMASSTNDHRIIQGYWRNIDKNECNTYYRTMYESNTSDAEANYLWARVQDEKTISSDMGREIIKNHPDYYWSYRILASDLLNLTRSEDAEVMNLDYVKKDIELFEQGLKKFPNDGFYKLVKFNILQAKGKTAEALEVIKSINDPEMVDAFWWDLNKIIIAEKDVEIFEKLYPQVIKFNIDNERIESADSIKFYNSEFLNYIINTEDKSALTKYLKENPNAEENVGTRFALMQIYFTFNNYEKALDVLEKMVDSEQINYLMMKKEEEFKTVHDNKRWKNIEKRARKKWNKNKEKRKIEALKARLDRDASDWELEDINGYKVKLSELKGKIVILDFWATWCGPCKMVMPNLDTWMKNDMPKDVEVYSINIFEEDPETAKKYFQENNYQMRLLLGNDDVASAYGINSIPYICMIDKTGKIAYEQLGFTYELEETLSFWVESLLKE